MVLALRDKVLRNTMDIDAFSRSTRRDILSQLEVMKEQLESKIRSFRADATYSRTIHTIMLAEVDATLAGLQGDIQRIVINDKSEVITLEYAAVTKALLTELDRPINPDLLRIPIGRLDILLKAPLGGHTLETWTKRMESRLNRGIKSELAQSLIQGESIQVASKRLRDSFQLSRRTANTLSRTALLQAGQDSRNESYRDNSSIIVSYTYLTTLDIRVCRVCAPDDGKTEEKRSDLPTLLRHPVCRCVIIANTRLADPSILEKRRAAFETTRSTVRHRDGTTSTKFKSQFKEVGVDSTFEQFFNSQPERWQRDFMGPGAFEIFKQEGLTLDDLRSIDDSRILTLDQLRKSFSIEN